MTKEGCRVARGLITSLPSQEELSSLMEGSCMGGFSKNLEFLNLVKGASNVNQLVRNHHRGLGNLSFGVLDEFHVPSEF